MEESRNTEHRVEFRFAFTSFSLYTLPLPLKNTCLFFDEWRDHLEKSVQTYERGIHNINDLVKMINKI